MAALGADALRETRGLNTVKQIIVAVKTAVTIYIGSLLAFTTLGRVQAAAAAANLRPAGLCAGFVNLSGSQITAITGNTGGTVKAIVEYGHEVKLSVLTAARTYVNLGKNVFIATDNEVTDTTAAGTATLRVKIGSITEFTLSTKAEAWVWLRHYGDADAV